MIISAKYASVCSACGGQIVPGAKINWERGVKGVSHVACGSAVAQSSSAPAPKRSRNWDSSAFAGYGRPRGAYRKACVSDGNCSSLGSGRSCGGHDCDGY